MIDLSNIDTSKLKGHNISANVMKISIPSFTFQLYINPCLHWIVEPAFIILASKKLVEEGHSEFDNGEIFTFFSIRSFFKILYSFLIFL